MKKISLFILVLLGYVTTFAAFAPVPGGSSKKTPEGPIDTNAIILVVVAVLLTVGVLAYKKLNFKKA